MPEDETYEPEQHETDGPAAEEAAGYEEDPDTDEDARQDEQTDPDDDHDDLLEAGPPTWEELTGVDPGTSRAVVRSPGRRVANEANVEIIGQLQVHTRQRTYTLALDGDAAIRLLSAFRTGEYWKGDLLSSYTSSAEAAWAVVDLDEVVAMYWFPGLPGRKPARIAIDPVA
jgi:hypothetical protein